MTLWENQTTATQNQMWIHGRLKRDLELSQGKSSKLIPEEPSVYPEQHKVQNLLLKFAVFVTGTTLIGLALYYSSSTMKNFIGMIIQLSWMLANIYWVEMIEGGVSKLMDSIICGMVKVQPFY